MLSDVRQRFAQKRLEGKRLGVAVRVELPFALDDDARSATAPESLQLGLLSAVGELPFGKGKMFGSSWNRLVDTMLGGWQANGILTLASGVPLVFGTAANTSFTFGGGQHPDVVALIICSEESGVASGRSETSMTWRIKRSECSAATTPAAMPLRTPRESVIRTILRHTV